jgi:membrane protein
VTVHGFGAVARRLQTTFAGRCAASFLDTRGADQAMAIAAQAFMTLIPLLILATALFPRDHQAAVAYVLIEKFRLSGGAAADVQQLFAGAGDGGTGVLSVVLLVFSGVSLTRRVQRMYENAWGCKPRPGVQGSVSALLGLAALLLAVVVLSLIQTLVLPGPLPHLPGWTASVLAGALLWTAIPWLLLAGRVRWRRLAPSGVLVGACTGVYSITTTVYMPRLMESYSHRYGLFGVTLALVGWLLCVSLVVVMTTLVAAEFDRAPEPWARRLRSRLGLEPGPVPEHPPEAVTRPPPVRRP